MHKTAKYTETTWENCGGGAAQEFATLSTGPQIHTVLPEMTVLAPKTPGGSPPTRFRGTIPPPARGPLIFA